MEKFFGNRPAQLRGGALLSTLLQLCLINNSVSVVDAMATQFIRGNSLEHPLGVPDMSEKYEKHGKLKKDDPIEEITELKKFLQKPRISDTEE